MSHNQVNGFATIKNHKLQLNNKLVIDDWIKSQDEGDDIVIRFTNQKDFRTYRQLKLLYKCFRTIAQETGHTVEEIKLLLKQKAGLFYSHIIENKEYTVLKSVGDMSKKELAEFVEFIDGWAAQTLNIMLLNSDDKQFLKT